jgi:hypothetical protein
MLTEDLPQLTFRGVQVYLVVIKSKVTARRYLGFHSEYFIAWPDGNNVKTN